MVAIDAWWRENRDKASDLFTDELEHALDNLSSMPSLGVVYQPGNPAVRRLLLQRTQYCVYFIEERDCVYVLTVWSGLRGRGPKLWPVEGMLHH